MALPQLLPSGSSGHPDMPKSTRTMQPLTAFGFANVKMFKMSTLNGEKIAVTVTFLNTTCKAARQIFQRVPFETSISFHFLGSDGRDIPASSAQQKPQYFPPFPGMADMDENLGDVVRWCRHIQLLEQMKHDFESLYFLILQISNDGCPSNIQQQLLGSRDEYLSLYSWVGRDHSF